MSSQSKSMTWAGRSVGALPVLALLMSASMKLSHNADMVSQLGGKLGYPEGALGPIGALELACTALYVVPQTSVLGAVLLTGYLGGAVATHVRVGQNFAAPVALGVLVWLGLFLRDERIRTLLPIKRAAD